MSHFFSFIASSSLILIICALHVQRVTLSRIGSNSPETLMNWLMSQVHSHANWFMLIRFPSEVGTDQHVSSIGVDNV